MVSLSLHQLSARYGRRQILDEITTPTFHGGQVVALLGPNAAGKSTLFRRIFGVLKGPGEIRLEGARRERPMAYMTQDNGASAVLTVYEAVLLARMQGRGMKVQPGDLTQVERALDELGISALGERDIGDLSGGQRQIVNVGNPLQQFSALGAADVFQSCLQRIQPQAVAVLIELRLLGKDCGLGQTVGVTAGGRAIIVRRGCRKVITLYGWAAAGQVLLTAKNGGQRRARTGQGVQLPAGCSQIGIQVISLGAAFIDAQANGDFAVAGTNLHGLGVAKGHDGCIHGTVVGIGLIASNIL